MYTDGTEAYYVGLGQRSLWVSNMVQTGTCIAPGGPTHCLAPCDVLSSHSH